MRKYAALTSQDDASITAIPVVPSRFSGQSSLHVQTDSTLTKVSELGGNVLVFLSGCRRRVSKHGGGSSKISEFRCQRLNGCRLA